MALHNHVESVQQRDDGKVYAVVVYFTDDGQFKQREEVLVDPPLPDRLIALVAYRMTQILPQYVDPSGLKALLSLQGTEILPPAVPTPPDPDPADVARNQFLALWAQVQAGRRKITAGLLQEDNSAFATLLAAAQKAYLDDYLPLG